MPRSPEHHRDVTALSPGRNETAGRRSRLGWVLRVGGLAALFAACSGDPNKPNDTPDGGGTPPQSLRCAPDEDGDGSPEFFAAGLIRAGSASTTIVIPPNDIFPEYAGYRVVVPAGAFGSRDVCLRLFAASGIDLPPPPEAAEGGVIDAASGLEVQAVLADADGNVLPGEDGLEQEVEPDEGKELELLFPRHRGQVRFFRDSTGQFEAVRHEITAEGTKAFTSHTSPFYLLDTLPTLEAALTQEGAMVEMDFTGTMDELSDTIYFLDFEVTEEGNPVPMEMTDGGRKARFELSPGVHHLQALVRDPRGNVDAVEFNVTVDLCEGVTCPNSWQSCRATDGECAGSDPCVPEPCLNEGVCAPGEADPTQPACTCDETHAGPTCAVCAEGLINPPEDGTETCRLPEVAEGLISPLEVTLNAGESQNFSVTATLEDGTVADPARCTWRVEQETLGTIDEGGIFTAASGTPGTTAAGTVICEFANSATPAVEASASVSVVTPELPDVTPPGMPALDLSGTIEAGPGETERLVHGTVTLDTVTVRVRNLITGLTSDVPYVFGSGVFEYLLQVPGQYQFSAGDGADPQNFTAWTEVIDLQAGAPPEFFDVGTANLTLAPGSTMVNIPVPRISADATTIILYHDGPGGFDAFPVADFPTTDDGGGTVSLTLTVNAAELGTLSSLTVAAQDARGNETDPEPVTWEAPSLSGLEVDCSSTGICSQREINIIDGSPIYHEYPFYFYPTNATTFEINLTSSDPPEFQTPGAMGTVDPASGNIADIIGPDGRARVTWTSGNVGLDNVRFTVRLIGPGGETTQFTDVSQE